MKPSVTARLGYLAILIAAFGAFALVAGYGRRESGGPRLPNQLGGGRNSASDRAVPSQIAKGDEEQGNPARSRSSPSTGKDEMTQKFEAALRAMQQGRQEEIDLLLEQLDEKLASGRGDAGQSIAAILAFLKTGQDAPTGQGFLVGSQGALTEATTLRVYLMNKLGILSRGTDGTAALGVAREVLESFGSADEWAVSMRNVAWFDPEGREFLQERVGTMLSHPAWRNSPSAGMLEAFDVIVHSGAVALLPDLTQLVTVQGNPLARASSVALDRLASDETVGLPKMLNQQPELLADAPLLRADLFSHANLKNPAQREQLEHYLLRSDVTARERQKFLASLIQSGRFVSENLITPLIPPESPPEARSRLETLMKTVAEWQADARFKDLAAELKGLEEKGAQILTEIAADSSR